MVKVTEKNLKQLNKVFESCEPWNTATFEAELQQAETTPCVIKEDQISLNTCAQITDLAVKNVKLNEISEITNQVAILIVNKTPKTKK